MADKEKHMIKIQGQSVLISLEICQMKGTAILSFLWGEKDCLREKHS